MGLTRGLTMAKVYTREDRLGMSSSPLRWKYYGSILGDAVDELQKKVCELQSDTNWLVGRNEEGSLRIAALEKQVAQGYHPHGAQISSKHLVDKQVVLGFLTLRIDQASKEYYSQVRDRSPGPATNLGTLLSLRADFCKLFDVED